MSESTSDPGLARGETSLATRLIYAGPALALSLLGITFFVYLPKFYTDVVGVELSVLGIVIIASRIWDAFLDPAIGALSDGTSSRLGRRRPWMLGAIVPLGLVTFLLLNPPEALTPTQALWWYSILSFVFFLFWTAFSIPYQALGAELSDDYHERTAIFSFREGALVLGTLLAAVLPYALESWVRAPGGAISPRDKFFLLGVLYAGLFVLLAAVCVWRVGERFKGRAVKSALPWGARIRSVLAVRPFKILVISYLIAGFGAALPATLMLYFVEYVLGYGEGSIFLVLYFGVGFLCVPLWPMLSRRIGKKAAWMVAMAVNTGAFIGVLFLGAGQHAAFGALVAISGIGFGGTMVMPSAMQADVFDFDELQNGERREGQFIGIWEICKKAASALGAGLAFPLLEVWGYAPGAPQTPAVQSLLTILYAGIPCICNVLSMIVANRYDLTEADHARTLAVLAERRGAAVSSARGL